MKKILICLGLVYALISTSACQPKTLEKAFQASAKVAGFTEQAAVAVGDLYQSGVISYATKEKIAAKLRVIVINGKRFHEMVKAVREQTKEGEVPGNEISTLDAVFSRELITPFLEILQEAGVLSAEKAKFVFAAIAALRQAILTISNAFGSGSASFEFYKKERDTYVV